MLAKTLLAVTMMVGAVAAQTNATYVDPNTVEPNIRANWCNGERSICSTLCGGTPSKNDCQQATLTYSCLCSNGSAPGLEYYKDTLPTNICQKSFALCITAHPDDATGQETCKTTILAKCGTLDIANFTAVASTTSVPTTSVASSTAISVASTTSAAPSTTTSKSAATFAASVGKDMGSVFVAAGLLGAFGYML